MLLDALQGSVVKSEMKARRVGVPFALRRGLVQVLYITPIFWFMELCQNWGYKLVTGDFGWGYPATFPLQQGMTMDWYSLRSLPGWAGIVAIFSVLDRAFERWGVRFGWRMLIAGVIGWGMELLTGYASHAYLHRYLQVWPKTTLLYVAFSALPIWCLDFYFFHKLTEELRGAYHSRSGIRE